jgi:hypothetical protein
VQSSIILFTTKKWYNNVTDREAGLDPLVLVVNVFSILVSIIINNILNSSMKMLKIIKIKIKKNKQINPNFIFKCRCKLNNFEMILDRLFQPKLIRINIINF